MKSRAGPCHLLSIRRHISTYDCMTVSDELRQLSRNGYETGVRAMLSTLQHIEKKERIIKILEGKDDLSGNTELHYCCVNGHTEKVQVLIDAGSSVAAANNGGSALLHYASLTRQIGAVRIFVDASADLVARNEHGRIAVDEVLQAGHHDVADFLMKAVEERAKGNEKDVVNGMEDEKK